MAKKNITQGIDSLIRDIRPHEEPPRAARPTSDGKDGSRKGLKDGEIRATYILPEATVERIKDMAYWDRLDIKEAVATLLSAALEAHEKKNGTIKPRPRK